MGSEYRLYPLQLETPRSVRCLDSEHSGRCRAIPTTTRCVECIRPGNFLAYAEEWTISRLVQQLGGGREFSSSAREAGAHNHMVSNFLQVVEVAPWVVPLLEDKKLDHVDPGQVPAYVYRAAEEWIREMTILD